METAKAETGVPEGLPEACHAALAADGEQLVEEMSLLEQMPQVRIMPNGIFDYAKPPGSVAQKRGIVVKLRCCKKTIDQKCNYYDCEDPRACPTHVEAARLLRAKVQAKHGSAECLAKACEAMAVEAAAGSSAEPAEQTVAQLMANQLAIQRAHRQLKAAQQQLDESVEAERVASASREAASIVLEEVCSLASQPARPPAFPPTVSLTYLPSVVGTIST